MNLGVFLIVTGTRQAAAPPAPTPNATFSLTPGEVPATAPVHGTDPAVRSCPVPSKVDKPERLVIPSLCINAPVVSVGDQSDGSIDIPTDLADAGVWNKGGSLAGTAGTVLVVAHVNMNGRDGVFAHLSAIPAGAVVVTTDAAGAATSWRVVGLDSVVKSRLPQSIFDATGPRRLVLVTCGGAVHYVPGYGGSYDENVIATATPTS